MITIEAALSDLDKLIEEKDPEVTTEKKILRAMKVVLKFLSTMRSNQLLTDSDKKDIRARRKKKENK